MPNVDLSIVSTATQRAAGVLAKMNAWPQRSAVRLPPVRAGQAQVDVALFEHLATAVADANDRIKSSAAPLRKMDSAMGLIERAAQGAARGADILGRSAAGPTAPLDGSARDVMLASDALIERPARRLGRRVRALTGTGPESEAFGRRVEGVAMGGIAPVVRAWQDAVHNDAMQTGDQGGRRHSRADGMHKPPSELRHTSAADPRARADEPLAVSLEVGGEAAKLAGTLSGLDGTSIKRIARSGDLVGRIADREARPVLGQLPVEAAFPTGVTHGASATAMVPAQGAPSTRVTHEVVFRLSADGETTRILLGNRAFRDAVVNEIRTWNAKRAPVTL